MKQKKVIGVAIASLLVLTGCTSSVKEDGKYVVASIDNQSILADDLYDELTSSSQGETALFSYILDELIKENFPVDKNMKEYADELINNLKTNYQYQYGEDADAQIESVLAQYGYNSLDEWRNDILHSLQYSEFVKTYVKDHFDEVFDDYYQVESPRIVSLIKVSMSDVENPTDDEKEKLTEIKNLLATDKSFAEIAADYSDDETSSAKGNLGVVDSQAGLNSTYGDDVETAALALKEGEVSDAIMGDDGYYFLYCTSQDKETIKKELKTVDINSPLLTYDDYIQYLAYNTYDIKYGDEDLEKRIKGFVEENLKLRDEQKGGQS